MASVDIRDAYYSIKIDEEYQKYLKFQWRDKLYKYLALPNGFSPAPRIFTKLLKPIFAYLRKKGHTLSGYIDDMYLQADNQYEVKIAAKDTIEILEDNGFVHHEIKSQTDGSQSLVTLGFLINSTDMTVRLTPEKKEKYVAICEWILKRKNPTIRELAQVLGKLVSSFDGVMYGPLYYRKLEAGKTKALKLNDGNYDAHLTMTENMKQELRWWIKTLPNSFNYIVRNKCDIVLESDAT